MIKISRDFNNTIDLPLINYIEKQLHLSKDHYLNHYIQQIKNDLIKPNGGLWTSTYSEYFYSEWFNFIKRPTMKNFQTNVGFILTPKKETKVLQVKTINDINLVKQYFSTSNPNVLDFEKMACYVDGISLSQECVMNSSNSIDENIPITFKCWDCEATLWFHWVFEKVEKIILPIKY